MITASIFLLWQSRSFLVIINRRAIWHSKPESRSEMMRIAVLSDTHGLLRPQVIETINTCDVVLHGGDIDTREMLDQLSSLAPLYVVKGNNDMEWAEQIPLSLRFELEGINFFMVHDKKDIPADLSNVDVVVYGHSHRYHEEQKDGRLYLNPGSCGKRRFRLDMTMAVIEIIDREIHVERIELVTTPADGDT